MPLSRLPDIVPIIRGSTSAMDEARIRMSRRNWPYLRKASRKRWNRSGIAQKRRCEPSRGGMGIRLKTKSEAFTAAPFRTRVRAHSGPEESAFMPRRQRKERRRFEKGPARAMRTEYSARRFRFAGLYITGLAQPNPNTSTMMSPKGSTCLRGFRVSLPRRFGVSSPRATAMAAWQSSCTVKPRTMAGRR